MCRVEFAQAALLLQGLHQFIRSFRFEAGERPQAAAELKGTQIAPQNISKLWISGGRCNDLECNELHPDLRSKAQVLGEGLLQGLSQLLKVQCGCGEGQVGELCELQGSQALDDTRSQRWDLVASCQEHCLQGLVKFLGGLLAKQTN